MSCAHSHPRLKVGVLYVNRQVRPDPWETMDATRNYFEFIRHLGWEVELVSHAGFLGGLDPLVSGETAPYALPL